MSAQDDYDPYTMFINDYPDDDFIGSFKEAYTEYKKIVFRKELEELLK
jgi:hypothetical protein